MHRTTSIGSDGYEAAVRTIKIHPIPMNRFKGLPATAHPIYVLCLMFDTIDLNRKTLFIHLENQHHLV